MKPNFALDFSHDGISLLHRARSGWHLMGQVNLDAQDLASDLAYLRNTAAALQNAGLATKLVIPNSQILYDDIPDPGGDDAARDAAVRAALDGATPYALEDIVFVWQQADVDRLQLAAVARVTLDEAEAFAAEHRFNPIAFVAAPEPHMYRGEPFFGLTQRAESLMGESDTYERDAVPVRLAMPDEGFATGRQETPGADDLAASTEHTAPMFADLPGATEPPLPEDAPSHDPASATAPVPAASNIPADMPIPDDAPDILTPGNTATADAAPDVSTPTDTAPQDAAAPAPELIAPEAPPQDDAPPEVAADPFPASTTPEDTATAEAVPDVSAPMDNVPQDAPAPEPIVLEVSAHADTPPAITAAPDPAPTLPEDTAPLDTASVVAPVIAPAAALPDPVAATLPKTTPLAVTAPDLASDSGPAAPRNARPAPKPPAPQAPLTDADALTIFGARRKADAPKAGRGRMMAVVLTAILLLGLLAVWALGLGDGPADQAELPVAPEPAAEIAAASEPAPELDTDIAATPEPAPTPEPTNAATPAPAPLPGLGLADLAGRDIRSDPVPYATPDMALPLIAYLTDIRARMASTPSPVAPTTAQAPTPATPALRPDAPEPAPVTPETVAEEPEAAPEIVAPSAFAGIIPRLRPDLPEAQPQADTEALPQFTSRLPLPRPTTIEADTPTTDTVAADTMSEADTLAAANAATAAAAASAASVAAVAPEPIVISRALVDARPRVRPAVPAQTTAAPVQAAAAAVAPAAPQIPTSASVAQQATIENALRLRQVNLIGVFGTSSDRRALVRLANGRMVRVQVGDTLDGGRVRAIGANEISYIKNGRDVVLRISG